MSDARPTPPSASELEQAINERRTHLNDTLDELNRRLEPGRLRRGVVQDGRDQVRSLAVDPVTGRPRIERLAAVAAALLVLVVLTVSARARRRRRDRY
jgi:hypothetical protein